MNDSPALKAMHIKQTHKSTAQPNLLKEHVHQTHRLQVEINNETPTMYKNNSRGSSKFKGCSPLQLPCNLTGLKPEIGYYSYSINWLLLTMSLN